MSKATDAGKSFLAGVLAKLPAEARPQAEAIFAAAGAEGALELLGTGALGQADINRKYDELRAEQTKLETTKAELDERKTTLDGWWNANKAALEEYVEIKPKYDELAAKGGGNVDPNKPVPPSADLEKRLAAELEARDRAFAAAMAMVVPLSARHQMMFNEVLEVQELMADPKLGTVIDQATGKRYGLQEAYDTKHGTRVAEKREAAHKDQIEKEVQKRLQEERAKLPQQMPYPLRDPSPSPLDALTATDRKTSDYSVDSAVETYNRLSEARQQASS